MIRTQRAGDITIFFCTEEKEWEDLTSKGQVVYHVDETAFLQAHPELGAEALEMILRAKKTVPTFRIMRVTRRDDGRARDPSSD